MRHPRLSASRSRSIRLQVNGNGMLKGLKLEWPAVAWQQGLEELLLQRPAVMYYVCYGRSWAKGEFLASELVTEAGGGCQITSFLFDEC